MLRHLALAIAIPLLSTSGFAAQVESHSPLFQELEAMDHLLFEQGFNNCELDQLGEYIHSDLEFYHDQGGLQTKAEFLAAIKENICSNPKYKPIRKLNPGTLEVFPMYKNGELYAAIQRGDHTFYIQEPGLDLYPTSTAKFNHLWVLQGDQWLLKRALSYDHQPPKDNFGKRFEAEYPAPLFHTDGGIHDLLAQHRIPSIGIGYIEDGVLQQVRVFGHDANGKPVGQNTLFKVASLTKPITAVVTLKLVEQGLWELDAPVSEHYVAPELKSDPRFAQLTTRHILSHQSGLPNWRYLTKSGELNFEFEPGSRHQYSGEGFEILRKALEAKLDKPFEDIAKQQLFEPLGMHNTFFHWGEVNGSKAYAGEHDEGGTLIPVERHTQANAAANLLTTVSDYGQFLAHLSQGAGLSAPLWKEFLSPHSTKKEGIHWGLGCQLLPDLGEQNELAVMHGGGDYGIKTVALILPNSKRGLLLFSNSENGMVLWKKVLEEYFGDVGLEIAVRNLK